MSRITRFACRRLTTRRCHLVNYFVLTLNKSCLRTTGVVLYLSAGRCCSLPAVRSGSDTRAVDRMRSGNDRAGECK